MSKKFLSSILAGMFIAMGGIAYLNAPPILGPFIFAIGILSILYLEFHLFTGKAPYISSYKELPEIVDILLGNVLGCNLMWLFPNDRAIDIMNSKLDENLPMVFVEAILCNILIYVAVETYKKQNTIAVIMAIATFIICGFEHSIANTCFIISARLFNLEVLVFYLVVVLGNFLGGILIHNLRKVVNK